MMASELSLLVKRVYIVMIGLVSYTEVVSPLTLSLKGELATQCDQSNTISDLVIGLRAGLHAVCLYLFDMDVLSWCFLSHCIGCYMLPIYYLYIMLYAVTSSAGCVASSSMVIAPQISVFVQKQGMKRNRI